MFAPGHYYFSEKLKIEVKNLCKLNCSYAKVSHALKEPLIFYHLVKKEFF